MKLLNKYIIGVHVMWYEYVVVSEYVQSLLNAMEDVENSENVTFDFYFNTNQHFEKLNVSEMTMDSIIESFHKIIKQFDELGYNITYKFSNNSEIYTHADYRRDLNYNSCTKYDYIIWGESDCLMPKQLFSEIEYISKFAQNNDMYRYIITFATRKMWDTTWEPLEHIDMTELPYIEKGEPGCFTEPHSIRYTMSIEEMNEINSRYADFNIVAIRYPKFDGSGLVISSDLIKAGANIPHGTNWMGEDYGFMLSCMAVMGEAYLQFIVKNILKVHNREHPKKRLHVINLDSGKPGNQQDKGHIYEKIRNFTKYNIDILNHSQSKFLDFPDIIEKIPEWNPFNDNNEVDK